MFRDYKSLSLQETPSSTLSTATATIYASLSRSQTSHSHYRTTCIPHTSAMSTTAAVIPIFTALTLLLGGFGELNLRLTLIGVFGITMHAAITPNPPCFYTNFDTYNPTQPPLRDYVLVFGLASVVLVSLFLRIYPLVSGLISLISNRMLTGV